MRILSTSGTKAGRKALKASASMLGLAAGAIGWSGLANAASDESGPQTLLLPNHYRLMDDGVVVFKLEGGEELSLNPDQYVILQDGLLLITDELAQASMESLPVMGAIRSQLMSDVQPIRSPDGTVVLASDASPLWSGDGPSPRLFEEVDIERFELASHSEDPTAGRHDGWNPVDGGLLAGGLLSAAGLLSNKPQEPQDTADSDSDSESDDAAEAPDTEYLSNIVFQNLTPSNAKVFTGSSGDSFIGYTAADPTAVSPLGSAGTGAGNSATFNMSAGGDNLLLVGSDAGAYSGGFFYIGGPGKDDLSFNMTLASGYGNANIIAGDGDNSLTDVLGSAGQNSGTLSYNGGSGSDVLTFGTALGDGGTVTLDLGSDTVADTVTFQGTIGANGGTVTIRNYNYNHDTINVSAGVSAIAGEITNIGGSNLTWTDSGGWHTIVFQGIGSAGTGVVATTAQLIADII